MASKIQDLERRLGPLVEKRPRYLEGPDGERWQLEIEPDLRVVGLPAGALVFANNGVGDHLFLSSDRDPVMLFRHEGPEIEPYLDAVEELLPDRWRPPSDHPPVKYSGSEETVQPGDQVEVRLYFFFKRRGRIFYVPGISPRKPHMERNAMAWVGIRLEDGSTVGTVVLQDRCELQKTVTLIARG